MVRSAAGDQAIKRHSGRKLQRVAPDRGFGGWGCPGPLALTGVGDQLTGAPGRTQSTHKARVFDKNQTSLHALHFRRCRLAFDYPPAFINHQLIALHLELVARPTSDERAYRFNSTLRRSIRGRTFQIALRAAAFAQKKLRLIQVKFSD